MMTAVMSLSLAPPSMLIAVNRNASALPAILDRGLFSISLIGAEDMEMCMAFASANAENRFVPEEWERHSSGIPVYRRAAASIICEIDNSQSFGTHMIIRGLVRDAKYSETLAGLVYFDGRFRGVAEHA